MKVVLFANTVCSFFMFTIFSYGQCSSELIPIQCEQIFSGTIGDNLKIQMKLECSENSKLIGSYYYLKHKIDIFLKGQINRDGLFIIEEYDSPNNLTGTFKGKFLSSEKIEGEWKNSKGDKSYPFRLERKKFSEKDRKYEICGIIERDIRFQMFREIENGIQLAKIKITGEKEIVLTEEKEEPDCIETYTIEVQKLIGKPSLYYIKWSTVSQGNGGYQSHYYLLFPEKHTNNILKRSVSQGFAGACSGGYMTYSVDYHKNILIITEMNHYRVCFEEAKSDEERVRDEETKEIIKYKVSNESFMTY